MQLLACTERTPELPRGRCLEGGQTAEQQRQDDQGDEGRDRRSQGNERQTEHRHHQPRSAQAADLAQPEGVMPEKVEGDPATQCYGRDRPQRIPDVPSASPETPTPAATIDSPNAMMTTRPWRSAKCPAWILKPETPRTNATP